MSTEPSAFFTSQVQPEPKLPTALFVKASLKAAWLPHLALIAAASAPCGSPACRLHAVPEEAVVPDLGGVVEHRAGGLPDDVLECRLGELGTRNQVVQVGGIGLMVLAVVELEGLLRDVRRQRIHGVRQGRQGVGHGEILAAAARQGARVDDARAL
jgi:hypothetical protein